MCKENPKLRLDSFDLKCNIIKACDEFTIINNSFSFLVVNETLDSIFDESGDEEEQDAIVNQVLDEIGIEISGKVNDDLNIYLTNFMGPKEIVCAF